MTAARVEVRESSSDVAATAVDWIVALAAVAIAERGRFSIALAGGSTPRATYEGLAARAIEIDWSRVTILYGDERCVSPDHELSNHRMATAALLSKVDGVTVRRIDGDDGDPHAAAERYERTLRELDGPIDLVLLGMGSDGHTASLFPGQDVAKDRLAAPVLAPSTSPVAERVSLTYSAIAQARAVIALVTGASKQARLREVLQATTDLPMTRVIRDRLGDVTFVIDQAAAPANHKEQSANE